MKILYITYMSLTEPLSHSQVLAYLKGLAKKNTSIFVLSFEKRKFATKENIEKIRSDLGKAGIKWFLLKYHKSPQCIAKTFDILCGIIASFFIVLKKRIDIIHARNTICAFIGILPILFLKKKLVFDIRGFMAEEYVDADLWGRKSFVYKFVKYLERYFTKLADENIVITQKAKEFLEYNYGIKNITVIPTCVDLERFGQRKKDGNFTTANLDKKKFTFIYTGSLGTWYMLPEMINFFNILLSQVNQGANFLILSQTEKDIIEKNVPSNLAKYVVIKNTKPDSVVDFLAIADAGIFFIKPCLSKISSCPTKFAEYLACGLPVVINKGIGDTEEIVRGNKVGVVIQDFSQEEYKTGAEKLLLLLKEGEVLSKRCREVAKTKFSLDRGVDKYLEVYLGLTK